MPSTAVRRPAVAAPNGTVPNTKIREAAVTRPSRCVGTNEPTGVQLGVAFHQLLRADQSGQERVECHVGEHTGGASRPSGRRKDHLWRWHLSKRSLMTAGGRLARGIVVTLAAVT